MPIGICRRQYLPEKARVETALLRTIGRATLAAEEAMREVILGAIMRAAIVEEMVRDGRIFVGDG